MQEIDALPTSAQTGLSSRLDRLESRLAQAITCASPRSTIREIVSELADHLRIQGVAVSPGVETIRETAIRATNAASRETSVVAGYPVDYVELASMWARARYSRAD